MSTLSIPQNYADIYNSLPIVEKQFELFKNNAEVDLLFKSVSQMNIPEDVLINYGLFLNHKHWEVEPDHVMAETTFENGQLKALKTKGKKLPISDDLVPVRWKIMKTSNKEISFMPLEFSNDSGAKEIFYSFNKEKSFFQEVAKEICNFQLESLLGFAILTRKHIAPNVQKEIYLETSKDDESVVTIEKRTQKNKQHSIPTTWSFDLIKGMECRTFCRLNTYCTVEWGCWIEGGEHVRGPKHTASSSHTKEHYPS